MVLTQPWLLLTAVAGIAALLIAFFLVRRRAVRRVFSAVSLLPGGSGSIRSALPWLDFGLMALVLLLAATSVAAPLAPRPQPVPVGFIVDPAAFDTTGPNGLRRTAEAAASQLDSGQDWGLFTTEGEPLAYGTGGPALAAIVRSHTTPGWLHGQPLDALPQAAAALQEKYGASPVMIMVGDPDTYAALGDWSDLDTTLHKTGVAVVRLCLEQAASPLYTSSIEAPTLIALGDDLVVKVEVVNTTGSPLTADVRLTSGGATVTSAGLPIAASGKATQPLTATLPEIGTYRYEISVAGPEGTADTAANQVLVLPATHVVVIASSSTASPVYVDRALKACPLVDKVTIIEPEALDAARLKELLQGTGVLVMDGVDARLFPPSLSAEVLPWVDRGGTLVFAYGKAVTLGWGQNDLVKLLPSFTGIKTGGRRNAVASAHPLVSGLDLPGTPLEVWTWLTLDVPEDEVLVTVGGEPMLTLRNAGKGSALVWASTTNPFDNTWALHPSFPAFWTNVLVYTQGGAKAVPVLAEAAASRQNAPPLNRVLSQDVIYVPYADGEPVVLPEKALAPVQAYAVVNGDFHPPAIAATLLAFAGLTYLAIRRRGVPR